MYFLYKILDTDWEATLLTDLTDSTLAKDDSEEENDDHPQPEPELNNFSQAIHSAAQLLQFCMSNDLPQSFEILSNFEDRLQAKAIQVKCQKLKQTSITSFFRK